MRLIDADALIKEAMKSPNYFIIKYKVQNAPTVDAVPVRHGRWIKISPAGIYECSECGKNVMTSDIEAYEYCHGCGARMDGDEE